jgi:hypothetical protein
MHDNASLYGLYVLFCWLAINLILFLRGMRTSFSLKEFFVVVALVSALFALAVTAIRLNNN